MHWLPAHARGNLALVAPDLRGAPRDHGRTPRSRADALAPFRRTCRAAPPPYGRRWRCADRADRRRSQEPLTRPPGGRPPPAVHHSALAAPPLQHSTLTSSAAAGPSLGLGTLQPPIRRGIRE